MKILAALILIVSVFSCQKGPDSKNSGAQAQDLPPQASAKTLNASEIFSQDLIAIDDINMADAESFPFTQSLADQTIQMVKLSYFLQNSKVIKSANI